MCLPNQAETSEESRDAVRADDLSPASDIGVVLARDGVAGCDPSVRESLHSNSSVSSSSLLGPLACLIDSSIGFIDHFTIDCFQEHTSQPPKGHVFTDVQFF